MFAVIFWFLFGLVLLVGGGELLVRGAAALASRFGISSLVIGLTVVAFGTSAPELAVSIQSAWAGQADIALGNVVGSNIFNVLVILGIAAVIYPLSVSRQLIRLDVPLVIGISLVVYFMSGDLLISRPEGALLFTGIIIYIVYQVTLSRRETLSHSGPEDRGASPAAPKSWLKQLLQIAAGLVLLVIGANWLVESAVVVARHLGISELVIGLTIVSAGTSLPELATSIIASIRGERDIAVGNVVGSNMFNMLSVLGGAALVSPGGIAVSPAALHFDIPVMIAVSLACLPIFFTGGRISRGEGWLFIGYYVAYLTYLILASSKHALLPLYSKVMLLFVIPLTAVTLMVLVANAVRKKKSDDS